VKEALVEEGGYFSRAGYATLAIDYRTFGESEGEPRGQLFPLNEVEDYRNAISYLQTRDEVDPERIGIWGTSFGGAVVIYTAAFERRAKAVVAQVPVVNGLNWMRALRTSAQWLELLDRLDEDRMRRFKSGEGARVPVTGRGDKGEFCAMPSDEQIVGFLKDARNDLKTWRPDLVLESVERIIEFFPENVIHRIAPRPLMHRGLCRIRHDSSHRHDRESL
jgi:acetyl esterase/lipase